MASAIHDLMPEQREIQALCREFAEKEIRPISLAVDEADTEMPWEIWYKAAELGLTSFMLPEEYGGGGMTDVLHRVPRPGGALLGLRRDRQPDHLERLLRRAGARARHRASRSGAGSSRSASRRPPLGAWRRPSRRPAPTRPRCQTTADASRRRLRPARPEDLDLERRRRRATTSSSRPSRRGRGSKGITAFLRREGRRRAVLRRADAEDGPAGDRQRRDVPRGRALARGPTARRRGPGLLRPHAHVRPVARHPRCFGDRHGSRAALEYAVEYAKERVAVREADRRAPGGRVPARGHGHSGRCGAPARLARGTEARRGRGGAARGGDGEAVRGSRRRCGARGRPCRRSAAGATRASTRSRSGCATRSSRRSRRALRTSSA